MADTAVAPDLSSPATPVKKSKGSAAAKKPKPKPTHPKTSEMVNSAIKELKERGGSSLQAIKKYISAQYQVDAEKLAPFIRKYLKGAVESGALVQTKGKGASGSFKLEAKTTSKKAPAPKAASSKPKAASPAKKKTKPAAAKPAKKTGAAVASKKKSAPKKPAVSPKKSSPKAKSAAPKAKKTAKPPTRKPKAPKPKATASKAKGAAGAKKTAKK